MQKESEYEEATNHRAGGEGHSSRPHGLPHGTGHHLVHGLRPNDALTLIKPSERTDSNVGLLYNYGEIGYHQINEPLEK